MFDEGLMTCLMAWRRLVLCASDRVMKWFFWIGSSAVERRGSPGFWGYSIFMSDSVDTNV